MPFEFPKRTAYRNKKILKAAQGEPCLVQIPGYCTGGGPDTVAAHSNSKDDGKSTGTKADDIFVAFCCSRCHDVLDLREKAPIALEVIRWYHDRAIKRTIRRLLDKGVIK